MTLRRAKRMRRDSSDCGVAENVVVRFVETLRPRYWLASVVDGVCVVVASWKGVFSGYIDSLLRRFRSLPRYILPFLSQFKF